VISVPNRVPTPSITVDGHAYGDVLNLSSTVTVHYAATDPDGNLSAFAIMLECEHRYFDNGVAVWWRNPAAARDRQDNDFRYSRRLVFLDRRTGQSVALQQHRRLGQGFKVTVAAGPNRRLSRRCGLKA